MDGRANSRAEAREIRMRTRLVDSVKQRVARWEKEMIEISEKLEKVFADAATDQVKKYTEEVCHQLQQEPVKNVKSKGAKSSSSGSSSSAGRSADSSSRARKRIKEAQKLTKVVYCRDTNSNGCTTSSQANNARDAPKK